MKGSGATKHCGSKVPNGGWQLTERFIGSYKVKEMVLTNTVKFELPESVRIIW